LPQVERGGKLSELPVDEDSGIAETMHVVFFPDNLIGAEFNFYAPRLSRLAYYINTKCRASGAQVSFEPLLRKNIHSQLDHYQDVRLFKLKILRSYSDIAKESDANLGQTISAAEALGTPESVQIELRFKDNKKRALEKIKGIVTSILYHPKFLEGVEDFSIKGKRDDTNKVEPIDLLQEQLIYRRALLRVEGRSRAIVSELAYTEIIKIYEEHIEELKMAPSIGS
jgi:hypothetical protein